MGGNIFDKASPIRKAHINATINRFYAEIFNVFPCRAFNYIKLGSTGKKPVSGDIDLGINFTIDDVNMNTWNLSQVEVCKKYKQIKSRARTATDEQCQIRAYLTIIAETVNKISSIIVADEKPETSSIHFMMPQYKEFYNYNDGKYVQVDLNFGNIDWLKFAYYSSNYSGNIKGLHRTQLMLAMFSVKGYIFSHNYGVKEKENQEIVATTPKEAIELLRFLYERADLTERILSDYHRLFDFINYQIDYNDAAKIFDTYLKILDSTRCDIPWNLQNRWRNSQNRLGLSGKFLPEESKLKEYLNERSI